MKSYVYCMKWADGSLYYGSTISLKQRRAKHFSRMKLGKSYGNVQKQYDAHGLPEFYLVQECESEEAGLWCERFFIESGGEKVINKQKPVCFEEERKGVLYYGMTEDEKKEAIRKNRYKNHHGVTEEEGELVIEWFKDYVNGIFRPYPLDRPGVSPEFKK